MRKLSNVTLICCDTIHPGSAILSMRKSMDKMQFAKCVLLTNVHLNLQGIEVIQIPEIKSTEEYSKFIFYELYKYFDTEYCLIVQHDSHILNENAWTDEFLEFDAIGANWLYKDGRNNPQGGFTLRSKRLQTILATDPMIQVYHPEDSVLGRLYRNYLIKEHGIKFPTEEICDRFAYELREPNQKTFGYHSNFHPEFKDVVVVRRWAACGDVISVEPLLHHLYKKGYRVVLDTYPEFEQLFYQHYFPIEFLGNFDKERIPYRLIDLDNSYESNPKQLHLKTYYEFAGVADGEIRNPKLNLYQDWRTEIKLFEKYCVLHVDNREQPHRNIYGVDWDVVCEKLKSLGYAVIQMGKDRTCDIKGALRINTPNLQFAQWCVASSDLFVGIDSGLSHIASGFDIPSIIFFGSVNPEYIHPDLSNKIVIKKEGVCDTPHCWSNVVGTTGQDCYIDKQLPPCVQFKTEQVLNAIDKIHDTTAVHKN